MLSTLQKNWRLVAGVALVAVALAAIFYLLKLKRPAHLASNFKSISLAWGTGNVLQNRYDSNTGEYRYLDQRDQPTKKRFKLRTVDKEYISSILDENRFWQMPGLMANADSNLKSKNLLRYELTVVYGNRQQTVVFLSNYQKDEMLALRAQTMMAGMIKVINDAEDRYTD